MFYFYVKLFITVTSNFASRPTRAKSAGSDSAPATPAKVPKSNTSKKTPAQVKAESNARKALEKNKSTPRSRSTPKTTPMQSPAIENKSLPGTEHKQKKSHGKTNSGSSKEELSGNKTEKSKVKESTPVKTEVKSNQEVKPELEVKVTEVEPTKSEDAINIQVQDHDDQAGKENLVASEEKPKSEIVEEKVDVKPSENDKKDDSDKTLAQRAAEKPVTGYATEEEYKAALAEKRRLAREAREREEELKRQKEV